MPGRPGAATSWELVDLLLRERLAGQPRTRHALDTDAGFARATDGAREALVAVADVLRAEGNPPEVAALLVRSTLARLFRDDALTSTRPGDGMGWHLASQPGAQPLGPPGGWVG